MLAIGTRVRIKPGRGQMKEFTGKKGKVIAFERDGQTNMYRVKLDTPVTVVGIGVVEDDLWSAPYLTDLDDSEDDTDTEEEPTKAPHTRFRRLLAQGFSNIRARGYVAHQNWQCCQTCGCAALDDDVKNYVFYHAQDEERIREAETRGLPPQVYLSWGGDGYEIQKAFLEAGLGVTWDGKPGTRILLVCPLSPN